MINTDYVVMMSRYNAWQNNQIRTVVNDMDEAALRLDRGAFFGSVFASLNHILFADTLWMSRWCSDVRSPEAGVDHTRFCITHADWDAARFRMDGRIRIWAQTLSNLDLTGTVEWVSGTKDKISHTPKTQCIAHMFNHQTHHRGQISQMLSELGATPPVSDIVYMPEDA